MSLADHPKSADVKPGLEKGPKQPQTAQSVSAGSQSLFLSVFDLFKIGIGPSSSHTMGPMTAARRFLDEVAGNDWPRPAGAKVDRIFVSLHGSWNSGAPTGYKIVRVPFANGRPVTNAYENFATGFWAQGTDRAQVWGRPVGLAVAKDGALLVADDAGGAVWRISYGK